MNLLKLSIKLSKLSSLFKMSGTYSKTIVFYLLWPLVIFYDLVWPLMTFYDLVWFLWPRMIFYNLTLRVEMIFYSRISPRMSSCSLVRPRVTLCDFICRCMILYDLILSHMTSYGHIRPHMTLLDLISPRVTSCGLAWHFTGDREGIWFHVDAAYAGSYLVCPEYQPFARGLEVSTAVRMTCSLDCVTIKDVTTWWRNYVMT